METQQLLDPERVAERLAEHVDDEMIYAYAAHCSDQDAGTTMRALARILFARPVAPSADDSDGDRLLGLATALDDVQERADELAHGGPALWQDVAPERRAVILRELSELKGAVARAQRVGRMVIDRHALLQAMLAMRDGLEDLAIAVGGFATTLHAAAPESVRQLGDELVSEAIEGADPVGPRELLLRLQAAFAKGATSTWPSGRPLTPGEVRAVPSSGTTSPTEPPAAPPARPSDELDVADFEDEGHAGVPS